MEEPRSRRGKATRIRKTKTKTKTTGTERERERKGNLEFIDQRCRQVVSEQENATEKKRDYGNLVLVFLSLSLSLSLVVVHNLRM